MSSIPTLLLLFNRPDTTRQLIDALRVIKPKYLYLAQDWPRDVQDEQMIKEVRQVIDTIDWDCEKEFLFQEKNLGCYNAVVGAIDWFFERVEFGIILEDDCIPSPSFFSLCEQSDKRYMDNKFIGLIAGSNFLTQLPSDDTIIFSQHSPLLWGWATWRDRWSQFHIVVAKKKKTIEEWNIQKKYQGLTKRAIQKYLAGNYWDADWYLTTLSHNWLSIVPSQNQITNVGAQGTHSGRPWPYHFLRRFNCDFSELTLHQTCIESDPKYDQEMIRFIVRMYLFWIIEFYIKRIGLFMPIKKIIKEISLVRYK
jgi:hypothetical protein